MFSGIVEETGVVKSITPQERGIVLTIQARICAQDVKVGDSIAVNGCCLTVEKTTWKRGARLLQFSVLQESWRLTNLQFAKPGAGVNLERALRVGDRLGGHFMTGHVDGMGKIARWEQEGRDYVLEVNTSRAILRQVVKKGSIAVDGISLTVAAVKPTGFRVWVIPHTREVTALNERGVSDLVNLETDLLGKYIEKALGEVNGR